MTGVTRLAPAALQEKRRAPTPPLLLDARRSEAFRRRPEGIANAISALIDESGLRVPDVQRDSAVVVYCLYGGQASSTRVAPRLREAGFVNVAVLDGRLSALRNEKAAMKAAFPFVGGAIAPRG